MLRKIDPQHVSTNVTEKMILKRSSKSIPETLIKIDA